MIPRTTVDRIMQVADIVEVVGEFVSLRKAGTNFKGLCPFHNERTPSFMVSPARGICKCFSCGKGGNVVKFLMEIEQMTYPEAIKWLGRKYGIEVQEEELTDEAREEQSHRESLFAMNEWAAHFFQHILHDDVDGVAIGMAYFRSRGFRDDIIRKFSLGYSPQRRDALAAEALKHGWSEEQLLETGLCIRTEQGTFLDRYRDRVIFPVHNVAGKVVAFGGRILKTDKSLAKYINSPESTIYNKSRELYGLYQAKSAIVRHGRCFLVEGYTDVISMHQCGIENVVASSGTSLTEGQIRLLHRFTENITVLYDGDAAGIKASLRGIDMLLSEGLNIKVLLLPDGDDPDSFARRHNAAEYVEYIDSHQTDFIQFKTSLLQQDAGNDPTARAALIDSVVQSISVIPRAITREVYIRQCATQLGISETLVASEVTKKRLNHKDEGGSSKTEETSGTESTDAGSLSAQSSNLSLSKPHALEMQLASLVIRYGNLPLFQTTVAQYIQQDLAADEIVLQEPRCAQILQEATAYCVAPPPNTSSLTDYFLFHPTPEISLLAAQLAQDDVVLSQRNQEVYKDEASHLEELVPHLLRDLKYQTVRARRLFLIEQLRLPTLSAEQIQAYTQEYTALLQIERLFAPLMGDRVLG